MAHSSTGMTDRLGALWRMLEGHRRRGLLVLVVMLCSAVAETFGLAMVLPLLTALIDPEQTTPPLPLIGDITAGLALSTILILLLCAFALKTALQVSARGMSYHFALRLRQRWTVLLLRRFLDQKYARTTDEAQGVVMQNVLQETNVAARAITQILDFANRAMIASALTVLLLFTHFQATVFVLVAGAAVVFLIRRLTDAYAGRFGELRLSLSQSISDNVAESIATVRQVKIFDLSEHRLAGVAEDLRHYTRAETLFIMFAELPYHLTELFVLAVVSTTLLVTALYIEMSPAEIIPILGFFALVAQRLITYITYLVSLRTKIISTMPSLGLVRERLKSRADLEALDDGAPFPGLAESIRFDKVGFRHANGAEVFASLDLEIRKGETVALIGPSGAGKSTVANLLLGLYRPDSGRILFDGRDAGAFSLRSLRQQIGYVSQEAELFHASIRENILMGRPEADAATFEAAVRAAHVDDFVRTLPEGYDTIVGDRGVKLSGGQRQRIAIARALLRRPALFIFDEATSALDRDSEAFIQQTINEIARDATVLIISHRPAAVRDADRIYRLDGRGGVAIVDRAEQTDLAN